MPRSLQDILAHADELVDDPAGSPEARATISHHAVSIRDGVVGIADGERRLANAIALARGENMSWEAIAQILGMSREAARRRYSPMITAADTDETA